MRLILNCTIILSTKKYIGSKVASTPHRNLSTKLVIKQKKKKKSNKL